jgi:3-oxoacyl-[acyl-carrier-protein] synthase-3
MLSDGAGAVLISDRPNRDGISLRIDWIDIFSFANQAEPCMYAGAVKQPDGTFVGWREERSLETAVRKGYFNLTQDVSVLAANVVPLAVNGAFKKVMQRRKVHPDDVDWVVPHLSSMFFKDSVRDKMAEAGFEVPEDRWFTNLAYKGNTGSASIYIMLEELFKSGKLRPEQRILCTVPESARFTYANMHLTVV